MAGWLGMPHAPLSLQVPLPHRLCSGPKVLAALRSLQRAWAPVRCLLDLVLFLLEWAVTHPSWLAAQPAVQLA